MAKSNAKFLAEAKAKHGDRYDYSKTNYINNKTRVEIICSIHGSFFQLPYNHLRTSGCSHCFYVTKTLTIEEFIEKAKKLHENYYGYSQVVYVSSKQKVKIICPTCGVFNQSPENHLRGSGCPKCAQCSVRKNDFLKYNILC